MVKIRSLEVPDSVRLLPGATQHWSDEPVGAAAWWASLVPPNVSGRTLVVGNLHPEVLAAVVASASSTTIVVRSIPDAAHVAGLHPALTVWCGDIAALPAEQAGFDTVVCLADFAGVLPLESEARSWRTLRDQLTALCADGGTVVSVVENDLGLHRITGTHNPLARNSDGDWSVTSTWDASRPRTVKQVEAIVGEAEVWCLAPGWPHATAAWRPGVPSDWAAGLVLHAASRPLRGPDPAWLVAAHAAAARMDDLAAAWLVIERPRAQASASAWLDLDGAATPVQIDQSKLDAPETRSLLARVHEACAAHDLPQLRALVSAWGRFTADNPTCDARFSLLAASPAADGWAVVSMAQPASPAGTWAALGDLIGIMRSRAWRTPFPSTTSDADLFLQLAAMAGLDRPNEHTLSASSVAPAATADPFGSLDRQQLVAAIDRNNETIKTLRSRLAWTELHYTAHKVGETAKKAAKLAKRAPAKAARLAKRAPGKALRLAKGLTNR